MKYNSPVNEWRAIAFASPHKITMWVMLKIFIKIFVKNLLWLAEHQCKGVVKFNMSDLFFWGQFRSVLVFPINLHLESQVKTRES